MCPSQGEGECYHPPFTDKEPEIKRLDNLPEACKRVFTYSIYSFPSSSLFPSSPPLPLLPFSPPPLLPSSSPSPLLLPPPPHLYYLKEVEAGPLFLTLALPCFPGEEAVVERVLRTGP